MKKVLMSLLALLFVAGGIAYTNQVQLLLALVKYKSATEYDIGRCSNAMRGMGVAWRGMAGCC